MTNERIEFEDLELNEETGDEVKGGAVTAGDLSAWQANFGQPSAGGSTTKPGDGSVRSANFVYLYWSS